jgi:hypothetical protein
MDDHRCGASYGLAIARGAIILFRAPGGGTAMNTDALTNPTVKAAIDALQKGDRQV